MRILADDGAYSDPVTSELPPTESPGGYGLNRTDLENVSPEEAGRLRESWVNQHGKGATLYVTTPQGQVFKIVPDGNGAGITSTVYEYQEAGMTHYEGPDAWTTLETALGDYTVVPTNPTISQSSIEAHAALVRDPIWFRVVQRLVLAIDKAHKNPYKKK